jgi:hypothetical protein
MDTRLELRKDCPWIGSAEKIATTQKMELAIFS